MNRRTKMTIPKEHRVALKIRYNSNLYPAKGLKSEDEDGNDLIIIFKDQLPRSYDLEHDSNQIEYIPLTNCIVPDESGIDGWRSDDIFDLDYFADKIPREDFTGSD